MYRTRPVAANRPGRPDGRTDHRRPLASSRVAAVRAGVMELVGRTSTEGRAHVAHLDQFGPGTGPQASDGDTPPNAPVEPGPQDSE
jgi:hypothetical protein